MNATATNTENKVKNAARIAATIILGIFAAVCLYAVLFLHRPDHLLTTAGYAAAIWMVNHKEKNN